MKKAIIHKITVKKGSSKQWPIPSHDLNNNGGFDEKNRVSLKDLTHYPNTLPPYDNSRKTNQNPTVRSIINNDEAGRIIDRLRDCYPELYNTLWSQELLEGLHTSIGFADNTSCILFVGFHATYKGGFQNAFDKLTGFKEGHRTLRFSPCRLLLVEFTGGNHKDAAISEHWLHQGGLSVMEYLVRYANKQAETSAKKEGA